MKKIFLALTTLALLSTGSANAQVVKTDLGAAGVNLGSNCGLSGVTLVGQPTVINSQIITQPAVVAGAETVGTTMLAAPTVLSYPASYDGRYSLGHRGLLGGMFGGLFGHRRSAVIESTALGYNTGCNTFSSVIPSCGATAIPVSGERIRNPWIDLHVFKFGFGFGSVSPRIDMRRQVSKRTA